MSIMSAAEVRVAVLKPLEERLQILGVKIDEIDDNFDLFGSGLLDSLGFVNLLTEVERMLGQPLDLDELDFDNLGTLGALVSQLYGLQSNGRTNGAG